MTEHKPPRQPDAEHLSTRPMRKRSTQADLRLSVAVPQQVTRCWRCGTPFGLTDLAALQRCTELARHPRPLRFEDIPWEDW